MIEYRNNPNNNIVEITAEGKITEADLDQVVSQLKFDIEKHGKLRILEEIRSFEGIDPLALWKDVQFGFAYINNFTHAAVVADAKWIRSFAEAVGSILSAEVKAFEASEIDTARMWLVKSKYLDRPQEDSITNIQVKKLTGEKFTLNKQEIATFEQGLRGDLIQPIDAEYEEVRQVYNGMIDRHPGLIVRCANIADVISAVNFARENNILVAVRGGGHNGAGLGVCDGGLVIDLEQMKGIHVDPKARTVRVEPGCRWGDVDHATHAFGLATVSGIISTTGVSGLTLGGGHGYLTRKYGLTIDNLLAADVVLADGRFVTASADENQDLFWAIRGGGGNFGIVTSFLFRLHPVNNVYAGPMFWSLEQAKDVMQWYREFLPAAPEDLYGFFAFLKVPPTSHFPDHLHNQTMCGVVWCYTGSPEQAEAVFEPIRKLHPPVFEHLGSMPYPALQSLFDQLYPPGLQWYWKGDFVKELSDEAIALHIQYGSQLPTSLSTMHLYPIDGAVHRVSKDETAFNYRDVTWSMIMTGVDPDPKQSDRITEWVREYWEAQHPYSAGGAYVNFMMDEGQERVQATYRDNYQRLVELKKKYDPTNLFRVNQNIQPRE